MIYWVLIPAALPITVASARIFLVTGIPIFFALMQGNPVFMGYDTAHS
jgi:hypothetical protein